MTNKKPFIDSHVHTSYSLLDGMIKIDDYVQFAKDNNFPALFTSDHGNVDSWINFYKQCKANDIKPILGSEVYLSLKKGSKKSYHLCLYAMNEIGYKNLIKLTTYANMENYYYKPRIDLKTLERYSEGLVCTTACVGSLWGQLLKKRHTVIADGFVKKFKNMFGENFYIEYGYHEFEDEKKAIPLLYKLAETNNVKTIIANDSHYLSKSQQMGHKVLMCKGEGNKLADMKHYIYEHNYYKTREEMEEIFSEFPYINFDECVNNTYEIIDKCNVEIKMGEYIFPDFKTPNGESNDEYLKKQINKKIKNRYPKITKEIADRVKMEVDVITSMNFSGYFLVVMDYVNWARQNDVFVGAGRGSAAGSIVTYILGITDVCPLKYNLLFERFLNPARVSFPDIDVDFDSEGRERVLEYLKKKYGDKSAVQISTRGYLKGKSAIKNTASKLGVAHDRYNNILTDIQDPSIDTIDKIIEYSEQFRILVDNDEETQKIVEIARQTEGVAQSIGKHAGGIIICHKDISEVCPIIRSKGGYSTAWTDKEVESIGLIKYDILGVATLGILKRAVKKTGIKVDEIPLDDEKTYELLREGDAHGVFQFEGDFAQSLLKRVSPEKFEDVAVATSANRPGALDSGLTESYIKRRKGEEEAVDIIPEMKKYTEDTLSLPIYQEQILFLFREMAGFSLAEADLARRAIGKKLDDEMQALKSKFIEGAKNKGFSQEKAIEVFDIIEKFARYGFNKSHSVGYSITTMQGAYLKANYREAFMCSILTNASDNEKKKSKYISDCFKNGISVIAPDVNCSSTQFELNDNSDIVYPLDAIKNVGKAFAEKIVENRNKHGCFKSVIDFCERLKPNKKIIQALLESDSFATIENYPMKYLEKGETSTLKAY